MAGHQIPDDLPFLGTYWLNFLESSFSFPTKIKDLASLKKWQMQIETFGQILPFIVSFWRTMEKIKATGGVTSDYYLNYQVEEIDFEALILSNFANFYLGYFPEGMQEQKLGIKLADYQKVVADLFPLGVIQQEQTLAEIQRFASRFGFDQISNFPNYVFEILREQMLGTDYTALQDVDYQYVGGPIIFAGGVRESATAD